MSEPAGIERTTDTGTCIVCLATSEETPQLAGTCIDTIGCVQRWVGIRQRREALKRRGGSADVELRSPDEILAEQQARESREQ